MSDISRNDSLMDSSPLSQACIKALTDRLDEKRKFAAKEIEIMTVEFSMSNNLTMINRLIIVLGRKFCLSHHQNTRKGGLMGLAAVMVGFKNGAHSEPPVEMVEEVVRPILTCLLDSDPRVRYYACEALFNVTKVSLGNILSQFELVFDSLTRIVADNDNNVRSCSETLDRLLKDIIVQQSGFNFESFILKLEEYIYTRNPFTRMFIISWIKFLSTKVDMIRYLPNLLDGIFNCLYDSTEEIRASTLVLMSEFLNDIVTRPSETIHMSALIPILLKHAEIGRKDSVQYNALTWLRQFIRIIEGSSLLNYASNILSSTLPCLALEPKDSSVSSTSGKQHIYRNASPMRFLPESSNHNNICEIATLVNSSLLEQVTNLLSDRRNSDNSDPILIDIESILDVLAKELQKQEHPVIKLAVLDWLKALKKAEPDIFAESISQQKLFRTLLDTLSARSDAVVKNALRVITEIYCDDDTFNDNVITSTEDNLNQNREEDFSETERKRTPSKIHHSLLSTKQTTSAKKVALTTTDTTSQQSTPSINRFLQALCRTFRENEVVFEDRGTFIILNLCSIVKSETVYRSFAEILKEEKSDLRFAYNLVQKLNHILLTTQPLFGLRTRLANDDDPEMVTLFHSLYLAWCHSPIATIALCLLTNNYRHSYEIVIALSKTEINVDTLTQIDWVVQLIESPIFASLRMRLLDTNSNQYLIQSLTSLLMILPQSDAYKKLSNRLDEVYKFVCAQQHFKSPQSILTGRQNVLTGATGSSKEPKKTGATSTSLESMMRHFDNVQKLRSKIIRSSDTDD